MKTTALKIASLCVVLSLLLTACVSPAAPAPNAQPAQSGSTTPKNGGTLIAARAADAKGLDPHKQTAFSSFRVLELIYDPLLALDKDLNVVPNLAESWKWSDDGKTLTLKLRTNVKFHNGDPLTADDVKFSYERILDEKTAAAARSFFTAIDKIDTPDPATVVFTLKAPNAALLAAMTNPNSAIISKKQVTGGADPAKEDVGTGAFKLVKWDPDKTLTLEANKDFWIPGLPHLAGIEFRTIPDESSILAGLRAGTLDWALINDPRVALVAGKDSKLVTLKSPALAYHVLQLNASRDLFKDVKVRQAISCAVDRAEVLKTASLGEGELTAPATSPLYRIPLDGLTCYKKDADKAKGLLKEAGKESGLSFKVIVANDEPPTALAEAQNIQAQLQAIGVTMEIEQLELGVYVDRWLKGDFDAAVALNGGNPDPDNMFFRYWHSTGNLNKVANYSSPDLDKLLDQGRATTDTAKRKEIYTEVQKQLVDAAPWVWLYVGYEYRVMQPYVKNFTPLSNGSLLYLREAWLDK